MVKCPFCHFENEDGALFCEQCKSDLAGVEPVGSPPMAAPIADAVPLEAMPIEGEAVPLEAAAVAEAFPLEATPIVGEAVPLEATPIEETAPMAEAVPLAEEPTIPLAPEPTPAPVAPLPQVAEVPPPPAPPPAPEAAPPPPAPAPAAAPAAGGPLPAGAQPRLLVQRGLKRNVEYPIYEGQNFIGRADEKPVDIDLEDQEPPDRIWSSRQHAVIIFENGELTIEDLNSSNGTFVNRGKIYPGQPRPLTVGDVVQIGTVQLKLVV
jgi:pSer/pThr/pTyr-binding forkhead associated (FHA) protein